MVNRKAAKKQQIEEESKIKVDHQLQQNGTDNIKDANESRPIEPSSFAYMDSLLPTNSWRLWWLPIALTFVCYGPNLIIYASDSDAWVYDDHSSVRSNPCVLGFDRMDNPVPWTCVFWADYWGTPMSSNMSHKSYRPVTTIFFIAERILWGFADSRLWHLGNVATKAVAVWLFSCVSKRCLTCPESAMYATLLFAVHPIHTESVSNITGQAESLSAVFMLLAFLAYSRPTGSKLINSVAAVAATVAATLSKEAGFSALAIICVRIISSELRAVKTAFAAKRKEKQQQQQVDDGRYLGWRAVKLFRPSMWLQLVGFSAAGLLIFIGRCLIQRERPQFNSFMNPGGFHHSWLARTLTMLHYAFVHVKLLLAPAVLCPDYSNAAIPELESLLDQRCLPMYLAAAGLIWSAILLVRAALDRRRDVHELVTCLAWLVLPYLPVSNLFFVVGFAVAERILFAPSIGFCLLVGLGVRRLTEAISQAANDQARRRLVTNLHRCLRWLLVLLAIRTSLRDLDWNNSRSLWCSAYKACQPNSNAMANLAIAESDNPGFQRFLFERATAVAKPFSMDHSVDALARVMDSAGQHREMLQLCQENIQGGGPAVTQCIAYALLQLNKPRQAVPEFQRLYKSLNDSQWHLSKVQPADVIRGYARSLALTGQADRAIELIRRHEPELPDPIRQHLAVTEVLAAALRHGQQRNDTDNFEVALSRLSSRTPSPEAFMDLAKELCLAGRFREALTALELIQPAEARQSPLPVYTHRFALDGMYTATAECRQREAQLIANLTGLSPLAALSALIGIAEEVAETDLTDSQHRLLHVCRCLVQPIDALLPGLDTAAKSNPPLSALADIRRLFLDGQRGELFLHSQMMTDRRRLQGFLTDMRQAERELAARTGDMEAVDWDLWALKPAEMFRLAE